MWFPLVTQLLREKPHPMQAAMQADGGSAIGSGVVVMVGLRKVSARLSIDRQLRVQKWQKWMRKDVTPGFIS